MQWPAHRILRMVKHTAFVVKDGGNVLPLTEKLLRKEDGTYRTHADTDLPIGLRKTQHFIFVACPEMTREVLHHDASPNDPISKFDRGWIAGIFNNDLGETLFTASSEKHTLLRQCISQYFRQSLDKRFGANLAMRTNNLIDSWLENRSAPINVSKDLPFFTSRAIIDNFIGEIKNPLELHHAMELILRNMERQFKLKRSYSKEKMASAQKIVRDVAAEVASQKTDTPSLLKLMTDLNFSAEDSAAMARFLFLAGQETVASLLPALIYHCTEEFQQNIRNEWKKEGLDINSSEAIAQFSKKSKWVQALINEALRLFPPAYAIVRVAKEDVRVGNVMVPKNSELVLLPLLFQRDPAYWGEDAAAFNPSRWFLRIKEQPFMPFGVGPNHCLGQPFARLEIGIFITLLCLRSSWHCLNKRYQPFPRFSLSSKEDIRLHISV